MQNYNKNKQILQIIFKELKGQNNYFFVKLLKDSIIFIHSTIDNNKQNSKKLYLQTEIILLYSIYDL